MANCELGKSMNFYGMKRFAAIRCFALLSALCLGCGVTLANAHVVQVLHIAGQKVYVEIADTDQLRQRGLMFRKSLAPNKGMLFIFDQQAIQCMWMKNTMIPLSVAFIDDQGRIVNIENMQVGSKENYCSHKAIKYALEMPENWFYQQSLKVGMQIKDLITQPKKY